MTPINVTGSLHQLVVLRFGQGNVELPAEAWLFGYTENIFFKQHAHTTTATRSHRLDICRKLQAEETTHGKERQECCELDTLTAAEIKAT